MKRTDMDATIAKYLYLAQLYSDGGKSIYELQYHFLSGISSPECLTKHKNYTLKDRYILRAIKEICKGKNTSAFTYYVCECTDGSAPYLVYFNGKIGCERKQISFHSFDESLAIYITKKGNAHKTKWDMKSSRETCVELSYVFLRDPE